ncbi:hypothetical protein [Thermogutta sp.]|uniref:hypothetical protein n=1 Tax=Thermogutta sp. TaxID=1962930 RepID=UPI003220774A
MSYEHHQMAHLTAAAMLHQVRQGQAEWSVKGRLSPKTTYWQGIAYWPRPDQAFEDESTGASLAIEFKPPGRERPEYVRGLGQVITYLELFEFGVLVVPQFSRDGFEIGKYLGELLGKVIVPRLPVAVLEYGRDPSQLVTRLPLCERSNSPTAIPGRQGRKRKVFWAYWRDLSQYELYELLKLMDQQDCNFEKAFEDFWKSQRSSGKALNWEGSPRKPAESVSYYNSELINSELSMKHVGLIDSNNRLTQAGYDLLRHGKIYGPDSMSFKLFLGHQILTVGRHIELILWVEDIQRQIPRKSKRKSRLFLQALDEELEKAGVIAKAPKGRAKATFLRDEPKLWNKLGLLKSYNGRSYFFPGEGFRFDWRACMEMVNYA